MAFALINEEIWSSGLKVGCKSSTFAQTLAAMTLSKPFSFRIWYEYYRCSQAEKHLSFYW